MAEHRQKTIAQKEDEYRARRRQLVISPARHDAFAGSYKYLLI